MKCPVDGKEMTAENFGVNVEVCESGCKGIWFDHGELQLLDQPGEGLGTALEAALRSPRNNGGQRGQIRCPKCSIPMHAHRFKRDEEVNVDECYGCGGFFLDSGELKEIRDHYMSDEQVKAYADQLINAVPGYTDAVKNIEKTEAREKAIGKFTQVLTMGYWRKKS